jgi:hypothetical protein
MFDLKKKIKTGKCLQQWVLASAFILMQLIDVFVHTNNKHGHLNVKNLRA